MKPLCTAVFFQLSISTVYVCSAEAMDERKNKRKQPSIAIDFTSYGNSNCMSSTTRTEKSEFIDRHPSLTNRSVRSGGRKVSRVSKSPPITPIKSSADDHRVDLNTEKTAKMQVKFRPKVMTCSPITPPPASGSGRRGDSSGVMSSCRRALDFDSDIETKLKTVYTKEGFCFTRKVRQLVEADKQKSLECNVKEENKWLKNEQELFRQRALSFISSMRLVQGNRSFMGWKGSVVDSVVGVFLTQNAADSMSSSAFMSLAAKYPKECMIRYPKNENHSEHALDWNAVRSAQPDEISHAIQERGMNNRIAARILKFLDSIHDGKSGLLDLEWLRNAKPGEAMDFFKGVYGLGLKSMECLRLLTLRQHAFPVDRHVSRIVVRLGWVPVETLPDGVLLHELEEYPEIKHVQEYLSHRLSNLDVETLHELHYQLITFGKVFCTKKKPNCNSCPLKNDCKHFASAISSMCTQAEPQEVNTFAPVTPGGITGPTARILSIPSPESSMKLRLKEDIVDIEDICLGPKIQPVIIKSEELMTNLWNYMDENNIPLKRDVSAALITLSTEETSTPILKLKNAGRLRTEHLVYELPDSHPLVQALDKRDADDRKPYLLAIWPPGETQNPSILLNEECHSLKSTDLHEEEMVFGTFLVPCRTATRGSFPLDGTFFQINEVFADHESSEKPLLVPKKLLSDLTTKTLYCGTSISAIFEGMSTQEIKECFWKGYVCIRGFSMKTRAPRPLHQQFHRTPTKTIKNNRKGKSPRKRTKK